MKPSVNDNFNGKNNIVTVKKSDFEVMDALEMDSIKTEAEARLSSKLKVPRQ